MPNSNSSNLNDAISILKALADPLRLRIMKLLVNNNTEMCVCEFADVLQEKQYNISKHLKLLENSSLIKGEKEGRWVYYGVFIENKIFDETLNNLISTIAGNDDQTINDQNRLTQRMKLRENGRCKISTPTYFE